MQISPSERSEFILTPYDIDCCTLNQDFDNFVIKPCFQYVNPTPSDDNTTNSDDNSQKLEKPPPKKVEKSSNFRLKTTRSHYLEAFIEKVEQSIFQPTNYNKKVFHNITGEERTLLKEIKTWENCCVRVQDKGSSFVILVNEDDCLKVNTQLERGSFINLPRDVTKSFEKGELKSSR